MSAATPGQVPLQPVDSVYLYHWRFDCGEEFGLYRHKADADAKAAARAAEHPGEGLFEVLGMAVLDRPVTVIAAQQPQPARADEFARVKVRLSALVASLDETVKRGVLTDSEFDQGAAHASAVTARQLREILNDTALGTTPKAATDPADAMFGSLPGRWSEPQPAPELAALAAKLAEVAAERDSLRAAPGHRELDSLREKAEAAEQEAADVRACAVGTFALIAVLARDNPAAQRQANELREQIGMLPSPPEADIAESKPAPEPPMLTLYREALERLADEDTPVLGEGLGGGAQEELHVRASFAAHALGRDTCGCTECLVSLGLDGEQ